MMLKLSVTFHTIYQAPTEIRAAKVKTCRMALATSVVIAVNFLQDQTIRNEIWNILVFRMLFTILTIKIS